jgi:hypothetical protein
MRRLSRPWIRCCRRWSISGDESLGGAVSGHPRVGWIDDPRFLRTIARLRATVAPSMPARGAARQWRCLDGRMAVPVPWGASGASVVRQAARRGWGVGSRRTASTGFAHGTAVADSTGKLQAMRFDACAPIRSSDRNRHSNTLQGRCCTSCISHPENTFSIRLT